jgi:peptide/nickel transport system permease protein
MTAATRALAWRALWRLGSAGATLLGAATLVFFVLELTPGDPVEAMLGEQALALDARAVRERLGLAGGPLDRYVRFLGGLVDGTLGVSLYTGRPVVELVAQRLPFTVDLAIAAMAVAFALALPAGVVAAARRGRAADALLMTLALAGISVPTFWLGPALVSALCVERAWLPLPGVSAGLAPLVLPALTLGAGMAAMLSRMLRASMIEALGEDYVRTARAKGLSERAVVWKHALRNALMPVLSVAGLQLGALLTGTIVTEKVFGRPGMGTLLLTAIEQRDLPVVQGVVVVVAGIYVAVNAATDALYVLIDPRVRRGRSTP